MSTKNQDLDLKNSGILTHTVPSYEDKNCYELNVQIPENIQKWLSNNIEKLDIIESNIDKAHISLIYGNDRSKYDEIHKYVSSHKIRASDVEFGGVEFIQPLHTKEKGTAFYVVDVKSPKLQEVRDHLVKTYLTKPDNIPLHVTLVTVKRIPALDSHFSKSLRIIFRDT